MNCFERFYTTYLTVGTISGGGGYSAPQGVYTVLGELNADVQPYDVTRENGGLLQAEYGLGTEVWKKMYCGANRHVKPGNAARIGGALYDICSVQEWGDWGLEVLMRKRRDTDAV